MKTTHALASIPDDELLRRLVELLRRSRGTEADLVAHIGEVDARRLYAREASPSMFAYCTEVLHLSEAEAGLRITAARASREHPVLLEMLADGRLHLSAIAKLAPHLTAENREALLRRAVHRSKRQVEELVAELAPRPDVPPSMRRLPAGRWVHSPVSARRADPSGVMPGALLAVGVPLAVGGPDGAAVATGLRPERVVSESSDGLVAPERQPPPGNGAAPELERLPNGIARAVARPDVQLRWVAGRTPRPAAIEPLAPARYKVAFTASAALRDKLERLRALMRSSVPDGDLATVIEAAVTEKLERLEARRFGARPHAVGGGSEAVGGGCAAAGGDSPSTGGRSLARRGAGPATRHVPAAVRRAVYERDGGRCRYVDERGRRCTAREGLEFHHRRPFGHGGGHSVENVALACRAHNLLLAEVDYGREAVGRHRRSGIGSPGLHLHT